MATNTAQLGQFGSQYLQQPYPYNSATYNSDPTANYNRKPSADQFSSASFPQQQVQNFIQSPPPGGRPANQHRYGERTVARSISRRGNYKSHRGPIVARDGSQPVVPIYSYPTLKNGTVVQVPIFWTALSIALGYEVQADQVIRGLPCIKRLFQLFCVNAGSQYPTEKIETFINENRALTRRMFGEFQPPAFVEPMSPRTKRSSNATMPIQPTRVPRRRRQAVSAPPVIDKVSPHLVDSCESKMEIVTPYWAANSAGEIRAIVNTKHFPQAIHQEICKGTTTSRCSGNCLCEQKYTYHRLLSYDPDNDCKGIFIDWFLFPSCCACRCPP